LSARPLDRRPYLEGGGGHGQVAHSQRGKGVEDGADHHRQGRGATAFAAGLDAKRVVGDKTSTIRVVKNGRLFERGMP
jgi:hypothetical protein